MDQPGTSRPGLPVILVLLLLWAVATGLNISKPVHIDDTAHLLIAQHIVENPAHPMSGMVNWLDTSEPIFITNQPHFFYYLLAGVMAVVGPSVLALHLLVSLFTAAAIWVAYTLSNRLTPTHALPITAALVLSPGFLINQNIMADVPLLALMGLAVLLLTKPSANGRSGIFGFSAFGLALLTKYTALFLFPALIWAAICNRSVRIWAVIPILALAGWSAFNYFDYGAIHILTRPANPGGLFPSPKLAFALFANLGVFAVPMAVILVLWGRLKWLWIALWVASFVAYYGIVLVLLDLPAEQFMALNAFLFASAGLVSAAVLLRASAIIYEAWNSRSDFGRWMRENSTEVTLFAWLFGGVLFLSTFPPFMATRHALLIALPFLILAARHTFTAIPQKPAVAILVIWGGLGVFTALSDNNFARFYQNMAPKMSVRAHELAEPGARVFVRGHWGWQWYVRQTGMLEYDSQRSVLVAGDILVDPVDISSQNVPDLESFVMLETFTQPQSVLTVFDTHRFYASGAVAAPVFAPGFTREIRILRKEN